MKKVFLKAIAVPALLITGSLTLTGCGQMLPGGGSNQGTPAPTTIAVPDLLDGSVPFNQIPPALPSATYYNATEGSPLSAEDADALGKSVLQVLTLDYDKNRTLSGKLSRDELNALLPEVEGKLKPMLNAEALANFSDKWKQEAAKEGQPESNTLMLATAGSQPDNWGNPANLQCGITDTPWKTTFSDPKLISTPVAGADYEAAAYTVTAHYLIPCAEGKIMKQLMQWKFVIAPSADYSRWEVYQWEHAPIGETAYYQEGE